MATFTVTFQMKSCYDDETHDLTHLDKKDYDADDIDELFDILDEEDFVMDSDDTPVINDEADDSPIEVIVDYVLIHDENGEEVYRDEDFQ